MNAKSTEKPDTQADVLAVPEGYRPPPKVRTITFAEIVAAAGRGMQDFRSAGLLSALFGIAYALGGIIVILTAAWSDMTWVSYPLATGFALVGPFAAVGLYDISRRLEAGTPLRLSEIMGVVWAQHRREIGWMAFVVLFVFTAWMYQVRLMLALFIGFEPIASYADFFHALFTTANGLIFLAVGHAVGAILALILFSLSVISFPILLDRDIDFITAMITSVQTVVKNPLPMLGWAFVVVILLIAASLPMFLGLIVVLPVLGHATWHIYRMAIEPEEAPAAA